MNYPQLFDDQEEITPELLAGLERHGLIVPEKSPQSGERRHMSVRNPTAGDVIGYSLLADKLKGGSISPKTAQTLLVLETARAKGPRDTHTARLITLAFATDKAEVQTRIDAWAKNPK